MGKVLTFTEYIRAGVLNRNDGIANIATLKKVVTERGTKVIFSDKMLKRTVWDYLTKHKNGEWSPSSVSNVGGVEQKVSTIIDSEEFDFAGTFVAKPFAYQRLRVFAPTYGVSINDYKSCMEFLTNMGLVKQSGGDGKTSIYNREQFQGLYVLSGFIDLERVGEQIIEIPKKIKTAEFDHEIASESISSFLGTLFQTAADKIPEDKTTELDIESFSSSLEKAFEIESMETKPLAKGRITFSFKLSETIKPFFKEALKKAEGKKAPKENLKNAFVELFKPKEGEETEDNDAFKNIKDDCIWSEILAYIYSYDLNEKESKLILTINLKAGKTSTTEDKLVSPPANDKENLVRWLYEKVIIEHLNFNKNVDDIIAKKLGSIQQIEVDATTRKDKYIVKISLTPEEKARRVKLLLEGIQNLYRLIEGRLEVLSPVYSIWSTELPTPLFHNNIQRIVQMKVKEGPDVKADLIKKVAGNARLHHGEFFLDFRQELEIDIDKELGVKADASH